MVTSSIIPHLPQSSRIPFRIGLLILLIGLTGCSILSLAGPLITIAALGVPLLFGLYLWQSGLLQEVPGHPLVIAATMGGALRSRLGASGRGSPRLHRRRDHDPAGPAVRFGVCVRCGCWSSLSFTAWPRH